MGKSHLRSPVGCSRKLVRVEELPVSSWRPSNPCGCVDEERNNKIVFLLHETGKHVQTYSYSKEIMDRVGCRLIEELGVLSASMGSNTSKSVYLRNAEICM